MVSRTRTRAVRSTSVAKFFFHVPYEWFLMLELDQIYADLVLNLHQSIPL